MPHRIRSCRRPFPFLLLLIGLLTGARAAQATHIVGGEMELAYQQGSSYNLILNLYFDAANGSPGALDPDLTASIFEKGSNRRMVNVVLPLTSNNFVNYTNPACAIGSLSTRKLVYSRVISLPATTFTNPTGYYVAVERCCRNNGIRNILSPSTAAQTFYMEFPAVVRRGQPFIDSTPRIFPPLADYSCLNELFYYDFGGQDADGDSLVYDLVTPFNGHSSSGLPKPAAAEPAPYAPINWLPGLNQLNQIPGAPTLQIGRFTGRLTVRPANVGLHVFGVRCSEYRDGEKIGEARRDFQLLVLPCAINTKPKLVMLPAPTGQVPYQPGRDTLHFVPGGNRCVRLQFTDPDPNSQLSLSLYPVNFTGVIPNFTTATSGTVRTPGAPDTLTATLCFPACLDTRGGVFLLDVIVGDNGCSLPKRDTVRVAFTAVPPPNSPPTISTTAGPARPLHVRVGDLVTFDVTGTDPDNDPITLEMTGTGFTPGSLGATLVQTTVGSQRQGRFTWRVGCDALSLPQYEFNFKAVTMPCNNSQAVSVSVPFVVDYANTAPILTITPSLPRPTAADSIPLIRQALSEAYTATLLGTDSNNDQLTLTATGEGFDLVSAGMSFQATNGAGRATGAFRWDASCLAVNLHRDLVVRFELVDATCVPRPQVQRVRFDVIPPSSPPLKLYNVITPNGDNRNDEFVLPELPTDFCDNHFATLKIFSRWGQQVYESTDRNFHWPGQGSDGLYYYLVTYTDGRHYKGWLEVVSSKP
jgi:gliding motility-associated-like protein